MHLIMGANLLLQDTRDGNDTLRGMAGTTFNLTWWKLRWHNWTQKFSKSTGKKWDQNGSEKTIFVFESSRRNTVFLQGRAPNDSDQRWPVVLSDASCNQVANTGTLTSILDLGRTYPWQKSSVKFQRQIQEWKNTYALSLKIRVKTLKC